MRTLLTTTTSAADAVNLGRCIGTVLQGGDMVDLDGDLGAGKTTTTVGIADGLGARSTVRSPTFSFIHHHSLHGDPDELLHIDLYRIDDVRELEGLALLELIDETSVVVVEWFSRALGELGEPTVTVRLTSKSATSRSVAITIAEARVARLRSALETGGFTVGEECSGVQMDNEDPS